MTEYVPLFKPGQSFTRQASAAITGGQLVGVSGSGTVAPTGAAQASWVGVAAFDAANGDQVTVHAGGVQRIVADGAVAAGDVLVSAATAGRVATVAAVNATAPTTADANNTRAIVGIALTAAAAAGELVEVQMER
jgi:hypothetical protein